ncbi:MAG: Rne/Rng family ribonuclease [Candidatus Sumerlaeia bacterium]|nr:Rne/Rng family ribonuclease [Candidatus Sumerlaeia bacterium]
MIDRILVNREECEVRVAFLEKDTLVELHTEKFDEQTIVNNIYRGRVQDVVPGLQAAFVDVGLERNMFLHFMDIRPESLVLSAEDQFAAMKQASENPLPGRIERRGRRPRQDPSQPQAESPVKKGDEIIIQVVKDEIGGKAPRVTTNLSLAGRYLVLLPFPSQDGGVSRKIAMGQDRFRLKKLLASLRTSEHSFIVRTAGLSQPEEGIQKDAEALERLWLSILEKYKAIGGPGLINSDDNLITRLVRDAFPTEFDEVVCDYPRDGEEIRTMLIDHMPGAKDRVRYWEGVENIFDHYGVEKQIQKAMDRKVWLKSGGHLIIDENEALTAIDVNTGRFTGRKEQEKTSLKTNMEACEAIAQQIRLRDIGGIIVIDFIDMVNRSHQERVSEELKRHLKGDRAKSAIGKIGDFGVMMLTRKRQRMSLQNQLFEDCPYCKGTGLVLLPDEIFRRLKYDLKRLISEQDNIGGILVTAHPRLIGELTSRFSRAIEDLSAKVCEVFYKANPEFHMEEYQVTPIRGVEGEVIRLPGSRLDDAARVLPMVDADESLFSGAIAASRAEAAIVDVPVAEEEAPSAPPPAARESSRDKEQAEGTGTRKRRRRSRRDGSKIDEATVEISAEVITATSATDEDTSVSAAPSTESEEEARQRKRRESSAERRARRRRAKDRRQDDEPGSEAADSKVVAVAEQKPAPMPISTGPLKLPSKARDPKADLLAGVLDEIEQNIETLKTTPQKKTRKAPAARKRGQANEEKKIASEKEKKRQDLADVYAELEQALDSINAESGEQKKGGSKTAAKGVKSETTSKATSEKKTTGRGRKKTTVAAAEETKPKAKTTKTVSTAKTTKSKAKATEGGTKAKAATKSTTKTTKAAGTTRKATSTSGAKKASTTGETKAKSTRAKGGTKSTTTKKASTSTKDTEARKSTRSTASKGRKTAASKSTSKSSKE